MKSKNYLIIGGVIALIQVYMGQLLEVNGIVPDLILVYIICVALLSGHQTALVLGLVIGFLYDIFFNDFIGLYSIFYTTIGYFVGYFRNNFFYSNVQIALVFSVLATIIKFMFFKILKVIIFSNFEMVNILVIFYTIIYNIIICIVIHYILVKLQTRVENERKQYR